MSKKRWRKISIGVGLVAGVFVDGCLRLISGDEGNLLVHTMVFLASALIVSGVIYGLSLLGIYFSKKQ